MIPILTNLGIVHTLIGLVALVLAIISLARHGKISPHLAIGKAYIAFTVVSSLTSFGIMKTGHLSPAHFLTVLILIILPFAIYFQNANHRGKTTEIYGIVAMTITLFLSFIPSIVETLTRVPVGDPVAESDQAPIIKLCIGILFTIFGIIIFVQIKHERMLRATRAL